jgi:hypothetical protein
MAPHEDNVGARGAYGEQVRRSPLKINPDRHFASWPTDCTIADGTTEADHPMLRRDPRRRPKAPATLVNMKPKTTLRARYLRLASSSPADSVGAEGLHGRACICVRAGRRLSARLRRRSGPPLLRPEPGRRLPQRRRRLSPRLTDRRTLNRRNYREGARPSRR